MKTIAAGGVDLLGHLFSLGAQPDSAAPAVIVGDSLRHVPGGDHLGAEPRHVALVDAELAPELLLGRLAPRQEQHQRVRMSDGQRLAARGRIVRKGPEPPEKPLDQPPQLFDVASLPVGHG